MAEDRYDFVIIGATLAAALLAALLAQTHGKRVLRVAPQAAQQRLSHHLDIALPIAARPQTWAIVERGIADLRALLVKMGALDGIAAISVGLQADTSAGAEFLSHLGHVAAGFGLRVRPGHPRWTLSRIQSLRPELVMGKLSAQLAAAHVETIERDAARVEFGGDGIEISLPSGTVEGAAIVLADDGAVLELPEDRRPPELKALPVTVTLTGRTRQLPVPVAYYPERRVTLVQHPQRHVLAIAAGEDVVDARIASTLSGPFPVGRLATSRYHRIETTDGAPLIGRVSPSGPFMIAGLGDAAAFAMPAIARWFAGAAEGSERAWLTAHEVGAPRATIAEFAP